MTLGFYLHIPFCKQRCNYCDFVSFTNIEHKPLIVNAMVAEVEQVEVPTAANITIYFGGGTPSILEVGEIQQLLSAIKNRTTLPVIETTIEVNPDDVTCDYLQALQNLGIDRISIGIQSFFDKDLVFLNRRHTSEQAQQAVLTAYDVGFRNISIDLMYGLPQHNIQDFKDNLLILSELPITHFSAYHLSLEKNTPLYQQYNNKKIELPTDEESLYQFSELQKYAKDQGFIHYEISNFCKPEHYSIHNSNYWKNLPYIGIGIGAHGYDGKKHRFENPTKISDYLDMIDKKKYDYRKDEALTQHNTFNELLFIGLRTMWGIDITLLSNLLSTSEIAAFHQKLNFCIANQHIDIQQNIITIPQNHWFISDSIIRDLMI